MKIAYFTHSLAACWNHGNAHFLRGVLSELIRQGHDVVAYEPVNAWSLDNLLRDAGETGLDAYRSAYPTLTSTSYGPEADLEALCDGSDVVLVHEWNDPAVVAGIGRLRRAGAAFTLLFHDTHHRAVSDPEAIRAFDLDAYDGVLAFGETLAAVYRRWGWGDRVVVWHEAADTAVFRPPAQEGERRGLVWIGNWGDGERSAELETYLFGPAQALDLGLDIFGVRYPAEALATLRRYGAAYHGWLPNAAAPGVFAQYRATVHVPRRFYTDRLPGIPTIRVFEALACGIPLVSAPWSDSEGLFDVGQDFLMARDGAEMAKHLKAVRDDASLRRSLVEHGLATIRTRHSCAHRVDELLAVVARWRTGAEALSGPLDRSSGPPSAQPNP
ncbi:glycosyltransferase [Lichenihabitans sp. PAMC28606]|uniref:CgeB family protein n=1 Tax=Lichenihabitans sp. PAMC28606 TaxID=2880932 RepID=UPI001D0B66EF|nr:glycosyltransferase [Lichenihabitans sp. PAMC28606]UDL96682.1 glycosyltransferase [Lichenihabitans sp. PAMC28606]